MIQPSLLAPPMCAARAAVRTPYDAQQYPDHPTWGTKLFCTRAPGHDGHHWDEHNCISWADDTGASIPWMPGAKAMP